jgi:hypothetical protein
MVTFLSFVLLILGGLLVLSLAAWAVDDNGLTARVAEEKERTAMNRTELVP